MIIFTTPTEMDLKALSVFGVSSKPNSDSPLGKFGTGLKYAIAIALRLEANLTFYIGEDKYTFHVEASNFRDTPTSYIYMENNGERLPDLPFTLDLGKHWDDWTCIREFESNTRDEGGKSKLSGSENADITPQKGHTIITIESDILEDCYRKLTPHIFMKDGMPPIYVDNYVEIFECPSDYLYFRGVRVHDFETRSLFTYNILSDLDLTEDRTDKFPYYTVAQITLRLMSNKALSTRLAEAFFESVVCRERALDYAGAVEDLDLKTLKESWFEVMEKLRIRIKTNQFRVDLPRSIASSLDSYEIAMEDKIAYRCTVSPTLAESRELVAIENLPVELKEKIQESLDLFDRNNPKVSDSE